jgi:hypothetical protein
MGKEFIMKKMHLSLCLVLFLVLLAGCGGGTNNPTPLSVNKAIVISANMKPGFANISSAITSIEVSFSLPANVSPALDGAGSLLINETGLKSLNTHGTILAGSYIGNTVHFILLPNDVGTTDLGLGGIARLTYVTTSGAEPTSSSIQPVFKVSGPGSRDISSQIEPAVSIVTYQKP